MLDSTTPAPGVTDQPAVIPSQDSLIGDLLSMDINAPTVPVPATTNVFSPPSVDLLGGGLDSLVSFIFLLTDVALVVNAVVFQR